MQRFFKTSPKQLTLQIIESYVTEIGFLDKTVGWFSNYLSDRRQCVQHSCLSSGYLKVSNGVPQGSVLGATLFTIYINNVGQNITDASIHQTPGPSTPTVRI